MDADDLMKTVIEEAAENSKRAGYHQRFERSRATGDYQENRHGSPEVFIIKVNPKKRMTFDPKKSLDFQGQTGPYVQNAYVRTQSVLRKAGHSTQVWPPDMKP